MTVELWFSGDNWLPQPKPYKSWPLPPSKLEQLATRIGVTGDELRELLEAEIQRRQRERDEAAQSVD